MELKTIQANAFRTLFEVLKDILNDVNLVFDEKGVHLSTLDISHVTFIDMHLLSDGFESYTCPHRILAGMNILNTFKVFKTITGNDILTLKMRDENPTTLDFCIENTQKKTTSSFQMKLLELNDDTYERPSLAMDVHTIVQSTVFQKIIREMSNFADTVSIRRWKNKLTFRCDGDSIQQETDIECPDTDVDITGVYSLKYINMFIKATGICSNIEIAHSSLGPISFKYSIANLGDVTFFLATLADDDTS